MPQNQQRYSRSLKGMWNHSNEKKIHIEIWHARLKKIPKASFGTSNEESNERTMWYRQILTKITKLYGTSKHLIQSHFSINHYVKSGMNYQRENGTNTNWTKNNGQLSFMTDFNTCNFRYYTKRRWHVSTLKHILAFTQHLSGCYESKAQTIAQWTWNR